MFTNGQKNIKLHFYPQTLMSLIKKLIRIHNPDTPAGYSVLRIHIGNTLGAKRKKATSMHLGSAKTQFGPRSTPKDVQLGGQSKPCKHPSVHPGQTGPALSGPAQIGQVGLSLTSDLTSFAMQPTCTPWGRGFTTTLAVVAPILKTLASMASKEGPKTEQRITPLYLFFDLHLND